MIFHHRIDGIPCQIEASAEDEYEVLDQKGYPAPWLAAKVTSEEHKKILAKISEYKEEN